jgi:hypothetical protein
MNFDFFLGFLASSEGVAVLAMPLALLLLLLELLLLAILADAAVACLLGALIAVVVVVVATGGDRSRRCDSPNCAMRCATDTRSGVSTPDICGGFQI